MQVFGLVVTERLRRDRTLWLVAIDKLLLVEA